MHSTQSSGQPAAWLTAIDNLVNRHYAVIPSFLSPRLLQDLHAECLNYHSEGLFKSAHIGRGVNQQQQVAIRNDRIYWLEHHFPAGGRYLALMTELQQLLNEQLFLGLRSFESHYAYYEVGSFYRRHIDRHRDNDARMITAVCYLNPVWPADAGGELLAYDAQNELLFRQAPLGGTLVLFTSPHIPHEVLPATQPRLSLTGWFRRD